jgi:hypothetical protein
MTSSGSEQGYWETHRIVAGTWEGTLGTTFDNSSSSGAVCVSSSVTGTSTGPDPGSLNPNNWDAENTLWIAIHGSDHGATTTTAWPSGYYQWNLGNTGGHTFESGGAGGAAYGFSFKMLNASSEDPGAFTTDASEQWVAVTVGVRGAATGPKTSFLLKNRNQSPILRRF